MGIALILKICIFMNQRITTRTVLPMYQTNSWAKSKYWKPDKAKIAKKNILKMFRIKKDNRRNMRLFIRVLRGMGVVKFRIKSK
ncbi:hypothetical protein CMI47_22160 [Candidatus Pacearchaeota archaeon]|nr:hypothetical protein [Candidatus Pacearchaeota archaeon]